MRKLREWASLSNIAPDLDELNKMKKGFTGQSRNWFSLSLLPTAIKRGKWVLLLFRMERH
ncbi:MAG TPA: hypothetical protein VMS89_00385 [Methanoregulaceae archaeon]|nr:hypothetical protein [Methanoregulaceae archaeon]